MRRRFELMPPCIWVFCFFLLSTQGWAGGSPRLWIGPTGGNWSNPANWAAGDVPDSLVETAEIVNGTSAPLVINLDISVTIGCLNVSNMTNTTTLVIDGPILTIDDSVNISNIGIGGVIQLGPTNPASQINGMGAVNFSGGILDFRSGTLNATAPMTVSMFSAINFQGVGQKNINLPALNVDGTLNWSAGTINVMNTAITINGSGQFQITASDAISGVGTASLNIDGELRRNDPVGSTDFQIPIACTNDFILQSGNLVINAPSNFTGATLDVQSNMSNLRMNNDTTFSSAVFQGSGVFNLDMGTFSFLSNNSTIATGVQLLSENNATFNGNVSLENAGTVRLNTVNLVGNFVFANMANAILELTDVVLNNNATVNNMNMATTNWLSGDLGLQDTSLFNNEGDFNLDSAGSVRTSVTTAASIDNSGTMTKANAGVMNIDVPVINDGTILVNNGTLAFNADWTNNNMMILTAPGGVDFGPGNHQQAGTGSITGDSFVKFLGGTTIIDGTYNMTGLTEVNGGAVNFMLTAPLNFPQLVMIAGDLQGTTNFTVSNNMNWQGGIVRGAGSLTINAGAILAITGAAQKELRDGRSLVTAGATTWDNGTLVLGEGANLDIQQNFSILGDVLLNAGPAPAGQITNSGVIQKTAGVGDAAFGLAVTNSGDIRVSSGGLTFVRSVNQTAGRTELQNANMEFVAGFTMNGGNLEGAGTVRGNVTLNTGNLRPGLMGMGLEPLNFNNDLTMGGMLRTELQIVSTANPGGFDTIVVGGTATLFGEADIMFDPGYNPASGDVFTLINAATLNGNFATINLPPSSNGIEAVGSNVGNTFQVAIQDDPPTSNPQFFLADFGTSEVAAGDPLLGTLNTLFTGFPGRKEIVSSRNGEKVAIVSLNTGRTTLVDTALNQPFANTTGLQNPIDADFNANGTVLWVLEAPGIPILGPMNGEVTAINTDTGMELSSFTNACLENVIAIAYSIFKDEIYVLSGNGNLCIFDSMGVFLNSVALPTFAPSWMEMAPDGRSLIIASGIDSALYKMDTSSFGFTTITLPNPPNRMDFDESGEILYVAGIPNTIIQVDLLTNTASASVIVPGAIDVFGVAVIPNQNIGFITDPMSGQVFSFLLDLTNVSSIINGLMAPTTIADNDPLLALPPGELQFSQALYQVNEDGGNAVIEVTRVGGSLGEMTATVATSQDTAEAGIDYQSISQTVQFADGEAGVKTVLVPIINDTLLETNEQLNLSLTTSDANTIIGTPNQAVLVIVEDEAGLFQLDNTEFVVSESAGQVNVGINRLGPPNGEVTLQLVTQGSSALRDFDFGAINPLVTFLNGEGGTKTAAIPIINNEVAESTEAFQVRLEIVNGSGVLGMPTQADVTILDDDPVAVRFMEMARRVGESPSGKRMTKVSVLVQSDRIADFPVFFAYQIEGTATSGLDHDLSNGSGVIPIGRRSAIIEFNILPDDLYEEDETLIINLVSAGTPIAEPARWILTILDDERRLPIPQVTILSPLNGAQFPQGTPIPFLAQVLLEDDATVRWEICRTTGNCLQRSGESFSTELPIGRYTAFCTATNANTGDVSTTQVANFQVVEAEPEARVRISIPEERTISIRTGSTQIFRASVMDDLADPQQLQWRLAKTGEVVGTGSEIATRFDTPGVFAVVVSAPGVVGAGARDWRIVRVTDGQQRSPQVNIISPSNRAIFSAGQPIEFRGEVIDPDGGNREVTLNWSFGNGEVASGAVVNNVTYPVSGRYVVRLIGTFENQRVIDEIVVLIQDPRISPLVGISPITDQQINPFDPAVPGSGQIFFRPLIRKSVGFRDFDYFWDFGNGETSRAAIPGTVTYTEEGTYTVTLVIRAPNGTVSPVSERTVVVKRTNENSFEPNNGFSLAPDLSAGQYANLAVDDNGSDFYKINIESRGQRLVVSLFNNDDAQVELYNEARELLRTEFVGNSGSLQLVGLNPGVYFLKLEAVPGANKLDVGYGLSLDVLTPSLYFPDVESSPTTLTELGMVNLSAADVSLEVTAFDKSGSIVARVPLNIPGNGRLHSTLEELFPEMFREVNWVQVDATAELVGYSRTLSRDGEELFATTASKKRASNLFVPHIAERVDQWFTRATVVNVGNRAASGQVVTPSSEVSLDLSAGFVQDRFDFVTKFGGTLPEDGIWARLQENDAKVNLVGMEVFGTKDGTRQVAGLELLDNQRDNPNFLYVANNLYFTHIASDLESFYTGIALVNTGQLPQSLRIYAYQEDGTREGPKTINLGPAEKVVELADDLLAGIGSTSETAWIMVEADSQIAGFEVFGTRDNKRLAGLEAANALQTGLCYPFIDAAGNTFHGVSLINPNDVANPMVLTLYNDQGTALATASIQLAPGEKLVALMRDLFPEFFNASSVTAIPGWLSVEAEFPTAGFELFTSQDEKQMGAILAQ